MLVLLVLIMAGLVLLSIPVVLKLLLPYRLCCLHCSCVAIHGCVSGTGRCRSNTAICPRLLRLLWLHGLLLCLLRLPCQPPPLLLSGTLQAL